MSFRPIVLIVCIAGELGRMVLGAPGGVMGSYLAAVVGASAGLFVGRRLQRYMDGD